MIQYTHTLKTVHHLSWYYTVFTHFCWCCNIPERCQYYGMFCCFHWFI